MTEFTDYPITTDPDTLIQEFVEELQSYWPNWQPDQGSLSYRQAAALLNLIAEGRDLASLVPGEIFRTMGESLYNLPPNKAEPARADTTWVMRDNAGYGPIPVGTLVSVDGILFETTDEVSVPSGSTQATPIGIAALDAGAAASGLGAAGGVVELEEAFEFVAAVTLIDATSGGEDDEDQDAYMARLVDLLQDRKSVV